MVKRVAPRDMDHQRLHPHTPSTENRTTLLSLAVPFYNEEQTIGTFFATVLTELRAIASIDFEIICVNDGSRDNTLSQLIEQARRDARIIVIDLTRNFGKEAAMTAAIAAASGDIIIPFDADLQDPPHVIRALIDKWREGYDVVLAKRSSRDSDSYLKKRSAAWFYRLHNIVSEIDIPENVGDFRLFTREVANAINSLPESRRFMKGLFAWVGFRTATIEYQRAPRTAGMTKFSSWKLWNFAMEGFTSFGTLPLRIWTYLGSAVAILAIFYAAFLIFRTLISGIAVPGYASTLTAVLLLGGIQLIGIGVLGEYIGRTYIESKRRPVFMVRRRYGQPTTRGQANEQAHAQAPRRTLIIDGIRYVEVP